MNAEEVSDLISPNYFNEVLNNGFAYKAAYLKLEVLSYSFDPEWSHLMSANALSVAGLIVNTTKLSRLTVENWMIHEGLEVDSILNGRMTCKTSTMLAP